VSLPLLQPTIRSLRSAATHSNSIDYSLNRLSALLSLLLLKLIIPSTGNLLCSLCCNSNRLSALFAFTPTDYPLCSHCRNTTLPTIRSTDYPFYSPLALLQLTTLPTIHSAFVGVTPTDYFRSTDYLLCFLCCYSNRISALFAVLSIDTRSTNYSLFSLSHYSNRLFAPPIIVLLFLALLRLTIRSNDYSLCPFCRYSNRLSYVHYSVRRYSN
jgi:hypothetical protein